MIKLRHDFYFFKNISCKFNIFCVLNHELSNIDNLDSKNLTIYCPFINLCKPTMTYLLLENNIIIFIKFYAVISKLLNDFLNFMWSNAFLHAWGNIIKFVSFNDYWCFKLLSCLQKPSIDSSEISLSFSCDIRCILTGPVAI